MKVEHNLIKKKRNQLSDLPIMYLGDMAKDGRSSSSEQKEYEDIIEKFPILKNI